MMPCLSYSSERESLHQWLWMALRNRYLASSTMNLAMMAVKERLQNPNPLDRMLQSRISRNLRKVPDYATPHHYSVQTPDQLHGIKGLCTFRCGQQHLSNLMA